MVMSFDSIEAKADYFVSKIPQIDPNTNFWMVRTKHGEFYHEFIDKEFIAIGWNVLTKEILSNGGEKEGYKRLLKESGYPDLYPGTAVGKCQRFIYEVKERDIVMIVGGSSISFAIIKEYYEEKNIDTSYKREQEIHRQIEANTYFGQECPYLKRHRISIISTMHLSLVPPLIYKCLISNRHSFSSLNEYSDAILSACYDVVYHKDRLIIKYHISQKKDINPIDFSHFIFSTTSLIFDPYSDAISGRYNINSEGDVIFFLTNQGESVINFIKDHLIPIMIIYFMLFGGKAASIEFPSVIVKAKGWILEFNCWKELKRIKIAEAKKTEAEVEKLKAETKKIEAETKKINLSNNNEAVKVLENLIKSANALQISKPSDKIIDIQSFFELNIK